jgi:CO/xanthine dehydrogenase Mo-binding subunit
MAEAVQPRPYIGQSLRRCEDRKFLTGKGRYVDDIKLPGTLHLAILRSPHAHARLTGMDLSAARAIAGVRLVLAGADLIGKIANIKPNWVIPRTVGACPGWSANGSRSSSPRPARRPTTHGSIDPNAAVEGALSLVKR